MSIWNSIRNWYLDTKDRSNYIRDLNYNFKSSYQQGIFPIYLKVSVCAGHPDFRNQFSRRFLGVSRSGISINALGQTYFVSVRQAEALAIVILSDQQKVRNLLSMGFDSLRVGDYYWKLESFSIGYI